MKTILIRVFTAIAMEVALHFFQAPFYLQIFPLALFAWTFVDIRYHTKLVRVEIPVKLPRDLQKQLTKIARDQAKKAQKQIKNPKNPDNK